MPIDYCPSSQLKPLYAVSQGLRNMLARLAPLVQQRALLQQVSDLQSDTIGNEVSLATATGCASTLIPSTVL